MTSHLREMAAARDPRRLRPEAPSAEEPPRRTRQKRGHGKKTKEGSVQWLLQSIPSALNQQPAGLPEAGLVVGREVLHGEAHLRLELLDDRSRRMGGVERWVLHRDVRPFARPGDEVADRELPRVWAMWSSELAVQQLVRRGLRLTAEQRGVDRRVVWHEAWGTETAPAFTRELAEAADSDGED